MPSSFAHEGDRLSAFLDDELEERAALAVTRHLAECGECHDELEELRSMRAALRSLPSVTPSLSWMVETVVLPAGAGTEDDRSRAAWMALAGLASVLVAAFLLGGDGYGQVRPPVDELVVDHVRSVEGGPVVTPVRLETAGQ